MSVSLREALPGNEKKGLNVCKVMVLLHILYKSLGVRLPVCPANKNKVLMFIKV